MLSPEQKALRMSGIAASEIAGVVGVSPYLKPIDVYACKVGLSQEPEMTTGMDWGHRLEPVIAQAYCDREAIVFTSLTSGTTVQHDEYPIVIATPDYIRHGLGGIPIRLLECKSAGIRQAYRWGDVAEELDGVPEEYMLQCQWQMLATGMPACDLAVLIAGQEFRVYPLVADHQLQASLLDRAERFWTDHVMARVPPPVDGSPSYADYLAERYPKDTRPFLPATPEHVALVEELRRARATRIAAEEVEAIAESRLKGVIADAAGIDGHVTWRLSKPVRRVDWAAVAAELEPPAALVERHTTERPGSRRFALKKG